MKTKIALIAIAVFGYISIISSQEDRGIFTCKNHEECMQSAIRLLQDAKRQYQLSDTLTLKKSFFIVELQSADSTDSVNIKFAQRRLGTNLAMEIEGQLVFELEVIFGPFLDIVPIWRKYVDADVDVEKLSISRVPTRRDFDYGEKFFIRKEREKYWTIERWAKAP